MRACGFAAISWRSPLVSGQPTGRRRSNGSLAMRGVRSSIVARGSGRISGLGRDPAQCWMMGGIATVAVAELVYCVRVRKRNQHRMRLQSRQGDRIGDGGRALSRSLPVSAKLR